MEEFITTYKSQIIWILSVIGTVVLLHFITRFLYRWLLKKEKERFPGEKATSIKLVRVILNALWIVLGAISIGFVFVDKEDNDAMVANFKLALYLGFLSVITIVIAATINMWFLGTIKKKIRANEDPTSYKFFRYLVVIIIYFTGTLFGLLAFPSFRGVAQTALGGAGILALVAGIASQEALSNLIGGIFIISFKPFKIGDIIRVTDTMVGTVTDITLRHTVIRNFENKMIVIPNAIINKEKLINYDLGEHKCCEHVEMGISYDSDVQVAKTIMSEVCENHRLSIDNRTQAQIMDGVPMVRTAMTKINDSTLTIRAWTWCRNFQDSFDLRCDVNETIKEKFDAAGIDLAYPTRTVILSDSELKIKDNNVPITKDKK
ncbi:small-conductance mechanosensitive channel [Nonlabens xylanidelens]|uniref:Small-conductance mechanosensitive channel n=1 Tax=Nonlabens xylanidelens TaxID=191564 RepID=A0A2S6IFJ7_9FLAO|nr:mechanosensitive ion channel family protein [Nonlabens xylanidelens]PPK92973.1 small-conductance mechanosensitive channel [Nonlabens xylanidelens]PQJ18815.1 mechanosensitive ion channel protein MscS [Nonlabens xylanidelens]